MNRKNNGDKGKGRRECWGKGRDKGEIATHKEGPGGERQMYGGMV